MVKNYKNYLEKVQTDWFEKNPDFFLSGTKKEVQDYKKKYYNKPEGKDSPLKNVNPENIRLEKGLHGYINITNPKYDIMIKLYQDRKYPEVLISDDKYAYKIIKAFLLKYNFETVIFNNISKEQINPLFKIVDDYYGLYYNSVGYVLFLTKKKKKIKKVINQIKGEDGKIIYFNNKTKGKEITDYESIVLTKLRNKLKDISYEDISFSNEYIPEMGAEFYSVVIDDEFVKKYYDQTRFLNFFSKETGKNYFGRLNNRYHIPYGLNERLKGIGLGYKIYKAFVKYQGFIVTSPMLSTFAKNIYYKLLQDEDIIHVIDKDNQMLMLIWKDYGKIRKLLKIVRNYELDNMLNYVYDKRIDWNNDKKNP